MLETYNQFVALLAQLADVEVDVVLPLEAKLINVQDAFNEITESNHLLFPQGRHENFVRFYDAVCDVTRDIVAQLETEARFTSIFAQWSLFWGDIRKQHHALKVEYRQKYNPPTLSELEEALEEFSDAVEGRANVRIALERLYDAQQHLLQKQNVASALLHAGLPAHTAGCVAGIQDYASERIRFVANHEATAYVERLAESATEELNFLCDVVAFPHVSQGSINLEDYYARAYFRPLTDAVLLPPFYPNY
jgi:hypothetical protein